MPTQTPPNPHKSTLPNGGYGREHKHKIIEDMKEACYHAIKLPPLNAILRGRKPFLSDEEKLLRQEKQDICLWILQHAVHTMGFENRITGISANWVAQETGRCRQTVSRAFAALRRAKFLLLVENHAPGKCRKYQVSERLLYVIGKKSVWDWLTHQIDKRKYADSAVVLKEVFQLYTEQVIKVRNEKVAKNIGVPVANPHNTSGLDDKINTLTPDERIAYEAFKLRQKHFKGELKITTKPISNYLPTLPPHPLQNTAAPTIEPQPPPNNYNPKEVFDETIAILEKQVESNPNLQPYINRLKRSASSLK